MRHTEFIKLEIRHVPVFDDRFGQYFWQQFLAMNAEVFTWLSEPMPFLDFSCSTHLLNWAGSRRNVHKVSILFLNGP
jgi:hypothetical protein